MNSRDLWGLSSEHSVEYAINVLTELNSNHNHNNHNNHHHRNLIYPHPHNRMPHATDSVHSSHLVHPVDLEHHPVHTHTHTHHHTHTDANRELTSVGTLDVNKDIHLSSVLFRSNIIVYGSIELDGGGAGGGAAAVSDGALVGHIAASVHTQPSETETRKAHTWRQTLSAFGASGFMMEPYSASSLKVLLFYLLFVTRIASRILIVCLFDDDVYYVL